MSGTKYLKLLLFGYAAWVAQIFAIIMRSEAIPLPPGEPDRWIAWAGDGSTDLEIMPRRYLPLSVQTFDKPFRFC